MRPYLLRTGLTMLIVSALALSCREDQTTEVAKPDFPESPYRTTIENYFEHIQSETGSETYKLSDLKNAIDYPNITRHILTNNEDVLIANIGKIDFEHGSIIKALFFIQHGEIVRSNLVVFSNAAADHDKMILSIYARRFDPQTYNGRISYYSIHGDILFFNEIDNGRLASNGVAQVRSSSKGNKSGRVEGCIDWYLVTTYHYAGGGSSTTEAYLTTTCDGGCLSVRMQGRTNCSGAGGSGADAYGPSFPTYAAAGDRYIFTDPDGKTTTYLYNDASRAWTVYLVVLPEAVVQSHRLSYPYLSSDGPPADNKSLTGPDDLLYIYDAWSGAWEAGPDFNYGGESSASIIRNRNLYFRCLKTSRPATLTIYVDQPKAGSTAPVYGTDVGHSWLSISQTIGSTTYTRVFGYYPENGVSPIETSDNGVLVNDSGHEYDVSLSFSISAMDVTQILNYANNHLPAIYDLNSFNCTDFVVDACRAAGFILPENSNSWLGGGGLCPGQLGEDLRTLDIPGKAEVHDNDGGNAPIDSGC
ncbi:MAG TPA: hypothetical protein VK508_18605 [Cyclobacteriaceae bacterium]|nr:hypothetical protein [Cyclobacteriaceae bacterium]